MDIKEEQNELAQWMNNSNEWIIRRSFSFVNREWQLRLLFLFLLLHKNEIRAILGIYIYLFVFIPKLLPNFFVLLVSSFNRSRNCKCNREMSLFYRKFIVSRTFQIMMMTVWFVDDSKQHLKNAKFSSRNLSTFL